MIQRDRLTRVRETTNLQLPLSPRSSSGSPHRGELRAQSQVQLMRKAELKISFWPVTGFVPLWQGFGSAKGRLI